MADIYVAPSSPQSQKEEKPKTKEKLKVELPKKKVGNAVLPFKERKSVPVSPLSSFAYLPKGVSFETKNREEKIVLLLRRHPITNLRWILIAVFLILAPLVLNFFPILDFLPANFRFVAVLGWYLITLAFIFENFLDWFFNVNIITDERIVDIDFDNLIYKKISEMAIDKIQDVTVRTGGVVRTMFNYGDVFIQTAAEVTNFDFLAVPNPERVTKILEELKVEEQQEALEGRVS